MGTKGVRTAVARRSLLSSATECTHSSNHKHACTIKRRLCSEMSASLRSISARTCNRLVRSGHLDRHPRRRSAIERRHHLPLAVDLQGDDARAVAIVDDQAGLQGADGPQGDIGARPAARAHVAVLIARERHEHAASATAQRVRHPDRQRHGALPSARHACTQGTQIVSHDTAQRPKGRHQDN